MGEVDSCPCTAKCLSARPVLHASAFSLCHHHSTCKIQTRSSPAFHRLGIKACLQIHATRGLQTPGFVKSCQEESSLTRSEGSFGSVAVYLLLTAKESEGDFQKSSGITDKNHEPSTEGRSKKSSMPSRAGVKAAVRPDSPFCDMCVCVHVYLLLVQASNSYFLL